MAEDFLKECKAAFTELNEPDHTIKVESLYDQRLSRISPVDQEQRNRMLTDLGFASSGSLLIDNAKLGKACTDAVKKDEEAKAIANTIASAELKMAEAILRGKETAKLMDIGPSSSSHMDVIRRAPVLQGAQKQIFDEVSKNPLFKVELKEDDKKANNFILELSMRKK